MEKYKLGKQFLILMFICLNFIAEAAAEQCYYGYRYYYTLYSSYYYSYYTMQCSSGCCGYYYYRYCCASLTWIAGPIIGGVLVAAIVITLVCVCYKKKLKGGKIFAVHGIKNQSTSINRRPLPPISHQGQGHQTSINNTIYGDPRIMHGKDSAPNRTPANQTVPPPPPYYDPVYPPPTKY